MDKIGEEYIDTLSQFHGATQTTKEIEAFFKPQISIIEKAYGKSWKDITNA